jgi:GxxExxY protein
MIDGDLTHNVIGAAMKVHRALGNGFQEKIYQRALEVELRRRRISNQRELEMDIFYEGEHIGTRRVDFLVADRLSVELKAITKLDDTHLAQGLNYLEAYNLEIGLLLNFGGPSLEYKRLYNRKATRA